MNGFELAASFRLVKLTVMAAMDNAELRDVAFSLLLLSNYEDELMADYPEEYINPG